jgi:CheY-like chemotaxis protein
MGNVEDVRDGLPAGDPARQQLDATLEAVRRSGQLTRQLLAFARRDGVSVTPLALREVLDDTAQLVRRTLGPDITVSVDCEPGLRVGGDRARLEQALVNLAFNARDAMPSGGTLRLRARHVSASEVPKEGATDQWVRLDVQDDGVGMTPEVRRRVFEPFFTTKEMGRGSGLGLSMVYAAMEQVGGATSIASEVGVGTTVSLWFPVRTDARAAAAADLHAAAPELPAAGPATLLLVEDDPAVRAVSARALRRAGYAVVEADDGVAGLEALSAAGAPFDLVISDVRMPRMGGAEFGAAVRRLMPDTPLLFLSGYQGEDRLEALLASPRTTLLAKPFRNQDLLATVAELLEAP